MSIIPIQEVDVGGRGNKCALVLHSGPLPPVLTLEVAVLVGAHVPAAAGSDASQEAAQRLRSGPEPGAGEAAAPPAELMGSKPRRVVESSKPARSSSCSAQTFIRHLCQLKAFLKTERPFLFT